MTAEHVHRTGLAETAGLMVRETQLIVPATLLLFVFQIGLLVNPVFRERMRPADMIVGVVGVFALAVAAALLLTPSAHGRMEPRQVSGRTVAIQRRAGRWPLLALAPKFAADVYIEARVVTHAWWPAIALGVLVVCVFALLWLALPAVAKQSTNQSDVVVRESARVVSPNVSST